MTSEITCPKCGASNKNITCFERDFYIVKNDIDFVKRKIYGCKNCEIMFAYDDTKKTSDKVSNIQSAFSKIAKQCENVTNNISIKH